MLNLTDVFNRFFLTSDPYITHLRSSAAKSGKHRELPGEVREMLKENSRIAGNESVVEKQLSEGEECGSEDEEI